MTKVYEGWTFKEVNGEVVRVLTNPNNIEHGPQNMLAFYGLFRQDKANALMHSGLLTSGLDWYQWSIGGLYDNAADSNFINEVNEFAAPGAKHLCYNPEVITRVYNAPYQVKDGFTYVTFQYLCDNEVLIKWHPNDGPTSNWYRYYFKNTYTHYSGTSWEPRPADLSYIFPYPGTFNYTYPSGIGLEWKWESRLPINNGLVLSGTLDCYHDRFVHRNSGDYFPPTSGLLPYHAHSTHGDVVGYWGTHHLNWYNPTVSGYLVASGLGHSRMMMDGLMPNYPQKIDYWILDGPLTFFSQENRNNPVGFVPDQTDDDDPDYTGRVWPDYTKFYGYINLTDDFDPNDLAGTAYYGKLAKLKIKDPEQFQIDIESVKHRVKIWQDLFPLQMCFNNIDASASVYKSKGYGEEYEFTGRDFLTHYEMPWKNVGSSSVGWWDWSHTTGTTWGLVQTIKRSNATYWTIFDYMSDDQDWRAPYNSHKHYMSYFGHAMCLLTDCIYQPGRYSASIDDGYDYPTRGGERNLVERGFYRKYEIGSPLGDPYLDGTTIKRDFTNGYVHVENQGRNLFDAEQLYSLTKIKTYQLRNIEIPDIYGAWITDENFTLSNLMYSGMAPVKAWEPELGTGPIFSGVDPADVPPPWVEYADAGCWYPSFNFDNVSTSGLLTAGPQTVEWPELTMYVYGNFSSGVPDGIVFSHYKQNGIGSIEVKKDDTGIFDTFQAKVFTEYYPAGVAVATLNGLDDWSLYTVRYKNGELRLWLNGISQSINTTVSGNLVGSYDVNYEMTIGGRAINGIYDQPLKGKLGTIIIASGAHSDAERVAIEQEILRRYRRHF